MERAVTEVREDVADEAVNWAPEYWRFGLVAPRGAFTVVLVLRGVLTLRHHPLTAPLSSPYTIARFRTRNMRSRGVISTHTAANVAVQSTDPISPMKFCRPSGIVFIVSSKTNVLAKMKSFHMKIAFTNTTVMTVFTESGIVMRRKIRYGPAPSIEAASYISRGMYS